MASGGSFQAWCRLLLPQGVPRAGFPQAECGRSPQSVHSPSEARMPLRDEGAVQGPVPAPRAPSVSPQGAHSAGGPQVSAPSPVHLPHAVATRRHPVMPGTLPGPGLLQPHFWEQWPAARLRVVGAIVVAVRTRVPELRPLPQVSMVPAGDASCLQAPMGVGPGRGTAPAEWRIYLFKHRLARPLGGSRPQALRGWVRPWSSGRAERGVCFWSPGVRLLSWPWLGRPWQAVCWGSCPEPLFL